MRKLITLLLFAITLQATAQSNKLYVGVAPIGLINKFRVSLEKDFSNKFSAGAVLTHYYGGFWKGQKVDLNIKYYFTKKDQEYGQDGIYSIFQTGIAIFKTPYTLTENTDYSSSISSPEFIDNNKSSSYGFGIGMGYRKTINRFFLDANFRFQIWNLQSKQTIIEYTSNGTKTYQPFSEEGLSFRTTGPGALFAPTLIFGYSF